jgi:hypothetical protein
MGVSAQLRAGRYNPKERMPHTHCLGGCADSRANQDVTARAKLLAMLGIKHQPASPQPFTVLAGVSHSP